MAYELQSFMKEKGLNPFKNLMVPLIQVIGFSFRNNIHESVLMLFVSI